MSVASPFVRPLPIDLPWIEPTAPCAHPLDDGTAFASESGNGLAVPESAVQAIGAKQYVFLPIKDSEGSFAVRQVRLGSASNNYYPVLDGLKLNDEVVKEGSFILEGRGYTPAS